MKKLSKSVAAQVATHDIVVRSDDGSVCFKLRPTPMGLWVQRDRRQKNRKARLVQSIVFFDAIGFTRWCEADSVRFDYPVVFSMVQREGGALLRANEQLPVA